MNIRLHNFEDSQVIAELYDKCTSGTLTRLPKTLYMRGLDPEAMYAVKSVEVHRSGLADIEFEAI